LVYQTGFGSIDSALTAARELLEISHSWESTHQVVKRFNIAQVFLLAGHVGDAILLHVDMYERGMSSGLLSMPLAAAFVLASIYRDLGSDGEYELWAARARELAARDPSMRGVEFLVFEAEDSFWRGEVGATLARSRELERFAQGRGNDGVRACAQALAVAAMHLEGRAGGAEFESLKVNVKALSGLRADDLFAQVACEELLILRREPEAYALLSSYLLESRKVRSPLWFGLSRLAKRLGVHVAREFVSLGTAPSSAAEGNEVLAVGETR